MSTSRYYFLAACLVVMYKAAIWLASNKLANEEESLLRLKVDFIVIKYIAISLVGNVA